MTFIVYQFEQKKNINPVMGNVARVEMMTKMHGKYFLFSSQLLSEYVVAVQML